MKSVVIPESVKEIGDYAFYGCTKLESVQLNGKIEKMGEFAFSGCRKLAKDGLVIVGDILFDAFGLDRYEIVVPKNIKEIGGGAFCDCENLRNITLPEGLIRIHRGSFFGLTQLEEIMIPEGVTEIEDEAFCRCSNLKKIILPESLVKIGNAIFRKCENLTIYAPAGSSAETYAKENGIRFVAE